MTQDEFIRQLPPFVNNPLPLKPPFVFNGLSARVFPLRASLDALQQMCDGYLNMVPDEAGHFRVAAPYVLLMVLDYGQLAEAVKRIGWFAQIEVFFGVLVEWYKKVNGNWVFHDWAVITPYIFVDDDLSVPMGRTVYGFPKSLAKVTKTDSAWVRDPLAPFTLASVETMVFPKAYAGTSLEMKTFLEIEQTRMSNLRIPFDMRGAVNPWKIASNLANVAGGFGRDAMQLAQAMRIFPFPPTLFPTVLQQMFTRMATGAAPWGPGFVQNSLNVKQFRNSQDPTQICYEGLTNGRMTLRTLNGAGSLGENYFMLGDLSGGHTIRLYEQSSLPIVRTLGLEVENSRRGDNVDFAEIKPIAPFWVDMDLTYEKGVNVAWRAADGIWKDETGAPFDPAQKPATGGDIPTFNCPVPSAVEAIAGPFEFPGTTTRVLPLLADRQTLQNFLDGYFNNLFADPGNTITRNDGKGREHVRFSVWARPAEAVNSGLPVGGSYAYVYLTASSFSQVTSLTNNVGDWAKYELAFMIPVKWEREGPHGVWNVAGVGMVPAYYFVDDCIAAISRLEVQGIDANTATFLRPESVWLSEGGALSTQTLLRVDAEVLAVLAEGQSTTTQPIIEISQNDPNAGLEIADCPDTPWEWAEALRLELGTKKSTKAIHPLEIKVGRALALELLGNQTPFSLYTLKQFRDVVDPEKACYQSVVRVSRAIKEVVDLREIEDTLVVKIYDYPTLDIVNTLGIVATELPGSTTGIVYATQAIRPFFIQGTLYEALADRLMFRAGDKNWSLDPQTAFGTLLSDEPGSPRITADSQAETLQDQMNPCRMAAIMYQATQRLRFDDARRMADRTPAISKEDARAALSIIDPQTVIESVLSREWGNADENARWRQGRSQLMQAVSALPTGDEVKAFAESVLYRKLNNELTERPGAVAGNLHLSENFETNLGDDLQRLASDPLPFNASERWRLVIERIILTHEEFTRSRLEMEDKVTKLSAAAILKPRGLADVYKKLGKDAPTPEDLYKLGSDLVKALEEINHLKIQGEPSETNNLDTRVLADKIRLEELILELQNVKVKSPEAGLEWALGHVDFFHQLVRMARSYCQAQNDALLNKLSRAYQKPDFCVRRDSVGAQCDDLLPLSLSWDQDWYYGDEIEYKLGISALRPATPPTQVEGNSVTEGVAQGTNP